MSAVATGLYHHRVRDHSLVRLRRLERWEAGAMAAGMGERTSKNEIARRALRQYLISSPPPTPGAATSSTT